MDVELWTLRYRTNGKPAHVGERTFATEQAFVLALQRAYTEGGTDVVATFPDGRIVTENALRNRYPPQ